MISSKNTVLRIVAGKVDEPFSVKIMSDKAVKHVAWCVLDASGEEKAAGEAFSESFEGSFSAVAWSV